MTDLGRAPIPGRFRTKCEFCGNDLDTSAVGVHQYTRGWVKARSGGGGHGVSLAERENRWAHGHCIDREVYGNQGKLFG